MMRRGGGSSSITMIIAGHRSVGSLSSGPTLADFIHRSAVLSQYRQFLRAISPLERGIKEDLRTQIRAEFTKPMNDSNRRELLAHGKSQLKQVQELADAASSSSSLHYTKKKKDSSTKWPWQT